MCVGVWVCLCASVGAGGGWSRCAHLHMCGGGGMRSDGQADLWVKCSAVRSYTGAPPIVWWDCVHCLVAQPLSPTPTQVVLWHPPSAPSAPPGPGGSPAPVVFSVYSLHSMTGLHRSPAEHMGACVAGRRQHLQSGRWQHVESGRQPAVQRMNRRYWRATYRQSRPVLQGRRLSLWHLQQTCLHVPARGSGAWGQPCDCTGLCGLRRRMGRASIRDRVSK